MKLKDALSEFYKEVNELFQKQGLEQLSEQLPHLEIDNRCNCGDDFCSTFYVKPLRKLNIVEENIIGHKHEKSIDLEAKEGYIIIDIDNFGSITSFEVLHRPDVEKGLAKLFDKKV